jgi:signal transduction histidine kinase
VKGLLLIGLIAGGCAAGVGVLGLVSLRLLRGRSVRLKLITVAATVILAMAAGVLGTAQAMFLSRHDFVVMLGVCVAAGVVALAMAILLAHSVSADSQVLHAAMRALGRDEEDEVPASHDPGGPGGPGRPGAADPDALRVPGQRRHRPPALATAELAALSRELAATGARLSESRERERALERSRRELVAWVSHDLRTPLAGLRAMAEALEDGVAPDPALYHVRMRQAVDRLTGMVDDLFELSRIHAGALRLSLEQISLTDLVDEAVVGADPLAQARGVRLSAQVSTPLAVCVDVRELSRALTNLVANAIRHTPSDEAVRVEAADHGDYAILAITDACGGIPDEDLERVFEVAWRGTSARTPEPQAGAGLGLAIVRGIVEAHAGEVDVRNVAGGCRFEVRLPVPAV